MPILSYYNLPTQIYVSVRLQQDMEAPWWSSSDRNETKLSLALTHWQTNNFQSLSICWRQLRGSAVDFETGQKPGEIIFQRVKSGETILKGSSLVKQV